MIHFKQQNIQFK